MIFDGLDELAQPGRDADEQTEQFLDELRFRLDRWNDPNCRVFVLVTGRPAVIQAQTTRSALRLHEGQQLEVLPFLVTDSLVEKRKQENRPFDDAKSRLQEDQRTTWWQRYAACKRNEPDQLPSVLDSAEIRDLSAEPLLLYLLTLTGYHKEDHSGNEVNRNEIYARLFTDVAERRHDAGRGSAALHELGTNFEPIMEVIATAAWYGDGRTATVETIRRSCPDHLKADLEKFLSSDAGVTRLIAAFYFQKAEAAWRRDAIEFTHKSFGEYLTARRLVRTIAEISDELSRSSHRYSEKQALQEWFDLTGQTAMDWDLLRFLRDEIRLHVGDTISHWQTSLCRLLDWDLRHGMPVKLSDEVTLRVAERQARNAEETLLATLNACARVTREPFKLTWPSGLAAGEFIHRLRGQRTPDLKAPAALECLGMIDLSGEQLSFQDLAGAHLGGSVLENAILRGVSMNGAYLRQSTLSGGLLLERDRFRRKRH